MTSDLPWGRPQILLSAAASDAVAEVHDSVMNHSIHLGRAGIMVALRTQARELADSWIGRDQVRSRAFEAAADDVAWGRAPLAEWRTFALDAMPGPESSRAMLRANVPAHDEATEAQGEQIARDIERRALCSEDALDAIRRLQTELSAAAELQALLWDDPRISATIGLRASMRASIAPLQRRAGALARSPRPTLASTPTVRSVGWRKLFAGL